MYNFIREYAGLIVVIMVVFIYLVRLAFVYKKHGWAGVLIRLRGTAYEAMLWMERNYPDDSGRTKFLLALNALYPLLTKNFILKIIITKERFAAILQEWYDTSKDFLDDGKLNKAT